MTKRDEQLRAYREYQSAVQEAEKRKPAGSWYSLSPEGGLIYDPSADVIEISIPGCKATIPGKYISGIRSALDNLMSKDRIGA